MDYFGTLLLSNFPLAYEKMLPVGDDGVEEKCLVIPISRGQLVRTKFGDWAVNIKLTACEPDAEKRTHRIKLAYRNSAARVRAKEEGVWSKSQNLGYLFVLVDDISKRLNRTNNMTPILCTGALCLDDIRPDDIVQDAKTGKRYVRFTFRKTQYLDKFGNSHEVVIVDDKGENQIGLAREWPMAKEQMERIGAFHSPVEPTAAPTTPTTPTSIDGYKF